MLHLNQFKYIKEHWRMCIQRSSVYSHSCTMTNITSLFDWQTLCASLDHSYQGCKLEGSETTITKAFQMPLTLRGDVLRLQYTAATVFTHATLHSTLLQHRARVLVLYAVILVFFKWLKCLVIILLSVLCHNTFITVSRAGYELTWKHIKSWMVLTSPNHFISRKKQNNDFVLFLTKMWRNVQFKFGQSRE